MCNVKERIAKNISYIDFLTGEDCVSCNKLRIANFQRNYVWTKKDIVSLFNSINETNKEDSLYIGNIVIQRTPEGNIGGDLIVDGQQRLITLSLIVNAIENSDSSKILFSLENNNPRIQFSREKSDLIYKNILKNEKIEKKNIDQVKNSFIKNYKVILQELKKIDDLDLFFEKIKKIEFVVIKCPTAHDVNQLFESLNSKGRKLSPIQLSKNSILLNAKIKEDLPKKINDEWEKLESSFEEQDSKIIWFDKFFRHRWFYIGGHVTNNNIFDSIKKNIKEIGVEKFTNELLLDSQIYLSLRKGKLGDKNNYSEDIGDSEWRRVCLIIEYVKKMNIDQVYSVLLALVKYGKNNTQYFSESFFSDVESLWKFLILIKYSKKFNPNAYERKFAIFCKEIHNIPQNKTFKSIRNNFFKEIFNLIPGEDEFIEIINKKIKCRDIKDKTKELQSNFKNINFNEDRDIIRSLLLLYITNGERIESLPRETIEHIIPKGNIRKWNNIVDIYKENIEKNVRYQLGNLTILEKKLNSNNDVGDEVFDIKFEKGYDLSEFSKNKKLKEEYGEKFNSENPEKAVVDRGKQIGKDIYNQLKVYKKI